MLGTLSHPRAAEPHPVRRLDIPDLLRPNIALAEEVAKSEAGSLKRLPLLPFGLCIVLVVDLQELLLYNIKQR